jgi:hypothetical protein
VNAGSAHPARIRREAALLPDLDIDEDLVDHTGRLLRVMADCGGTGMTLKSTTRARASSSMRTSLT